MRLKLIYEDGPGHWEPIAGHPGKLGDKDPRAKKNKKRPSFLTHPEDRERWLKWFSGGKIKEDLDDKDEFGSQVKEAYEKEEPGATKYIFNFNDGAAMYSLHAGQRQVTVIASPSGEMRLYKYDDQEYREYLSSIATYNTVHGGRYGNNPPQPFTPEMDTHFNTIISTYARM